MRIIFITILIFALTSCKGQNKQEKTQKETIMKTFDIETFEKNKQNAHEYFFIKDDSIYVKQYRGNDNYWETIRPKDTLLETFNSFYKNGKLEYTAKRFSYFTLGIMKKYDKQGNLIKETDLDKPFTYSWKDIKKYLKEHGVNDFEKDIVGIQRFNNPDKTYWELEFNGKYKDIKGQFSIELDGKTGEELLVKLFKGKDSEGEVGTIAVYDTIYKKKNK